MTDLPIALSLLAIAAVVAWGAWDFLRSEADTDYRAGGTRWWCSRCQTVVRRRADDTGECSCASSPSPWWPIDDDGRIVDR